MRDFKKLKLWQKSHDLTVAIYGVTRKFPREEIYGLTSQIRRASASIPANIAEGCGRGGDVEFCRFLQIARGSASELEYHLILSRDIGLLEPELYGHMEASVCEVKKMLTKLIQTLKIDG